MTGKPLIYSREAPRSRTRHPGSQASRPGMRAPARRCLYKGHRINYVQTLERGNIKERERNEKNEAREKISKPADGIGNGAWNERWNNCDSIRSKH